MDSGGLAVTNARFAALHRLPVARLPLDDARSTPQNRALVTSGNGLAASAAGFRLRLGGGVALRLRSSRLSACASLLPLADRRPKPRLTELRIVQIINQQFHCPVLACLLASKIHIGK